MKPKHVPDGYHTISPYLTIFGVAKLITFLQEALGALETERVLRGDGTIGHAEVRIGDSVVMLGEARSEWPAMPGMLYVYVEDTDATYAKALKAGGTSLMEPADQFYGDRTAGIKDPCGNYWWLATRKENLSSEELKKRAAAAAH